MGDVTRIRYSGLPPERVHVDPEVVDLPVHARARDARDPRGQRDVAAGAAEELGEVEDLRDPEGLPQAEVAALRQELDELKTSFAEFKTAFE